MNQKKIIKQSPGQIFFYDTHYTFMSVKQIAFFIYKGKLYSQFDTMHMDFIHGLKAKDS